MDKRQLRKIYREGRSALPREVRQREETAALRRLQAHPRFQKAPRIFLYAAYGSEFPTQSIAALAQSLGKEIAYPKVEGQEMTFYLGGRLKEGFKGIHEPIGGRAAVPCKEDLMLLPGLAFTKEGGRLGYGGGYYDRYLAACKEIPYLIGLSFSCQMAKELPREPFDYLVDEVL